MNQYVVSHENFVSTCVELEKAIVFLIFFDAVNGGRVDLQKFLIKNRGSSSCYRPIGISLDYI